MAANIIKNIITGSWLGSELRANNFYFILFVVLLVIVLIFNRYRAEELIIEKRKIKDEVEILHSKFTKLDTKLMILGTERKVANDTTIQALGLRLPENPPKVIIIK